MAKRPNFILFIADQLRADHLGCYGNPIVKTDAIDALAARGTRFRRFYVVNPACMPNRASLMTGRMSSISGVRSNGIPLSLQATTFVDLLRVAGYRTASVGKIHLQNMMSHPPLAPALAEHARAAPPSRYADATWEDLCAPDYDQESQARWRNDPSHEMRLPYYGFSHVDLTAMHADDVHGHYRRWLESRHPGSDRLIGRENSLPFEGVSQLQAWRTRVPEELYSTSYVTLKAEQYLRRHAAEDRAAPFFLQCSFNDPHHPFTPPGRYFDMYSPADITLPRSFHAVHRNPPRPLQLLRDTRDQGRQDPDSWIIQAVRENDVRQAIALTYGSITMIDHAIARVLEALAELKMANDTVIIFTSDHGDFMGDHQLLLKGPLHYDGIVRVPFIWCDPQRSDRRRQTDCLGSTADISATVLARAGLLPFNGIQGRDLLPAIACEDEGAHDILVEEDNQRAFLGFTRPVRLRSLITRQWRLSMFRGCEWGELYDLERDPDETQNLWGDAGYAKIQAELTQRMAQRLIDLADDAPRATGRA